MATPSSKPLKVLVVDDDELNRRMMNLILTREGHHVQIVSDGMEALRATEVHEFDIILMDLQMPVMDGVEASRRIRERENGATNAYIVALTASYLPEKGRELFDAGIDNYIAKPFDISHLRQMLEHGLDHRKTRKRIKSPVLVDVSEISTSRELNVSAGIKLVGGDEETYRELLADFLEQLPEKIRTIDRCFAENDLEGLARAAHNIKGISSSLGALQLNEYAGGLEKRVSEGYTITSLESVVRELKEISRKFTVVASVFLADAQNEINFS